MASFDLYFPQLLRFEGGFVDDPADPGGATNRGITVATFQRDAQPVLGEAPTLQALHALTPMQAAAIYKQDYWDKLDADQIASQPLAEILFDFYVNAGTEAVLLLQRILQQLGASGLAVDGQMGAATLAALQAADPAKVYALYRQGRIDYYQRLAAERPADARFLAGWIARAEWFPATLPSASAAAPSGDVA
ncbi:glycosyl hydrolase 108 family protein [Xanthomonas sp. NCPPB 2654]|uniref:glycoside hydrolase family 108 protein n=1 Tax=unclassified Xanthomonas TaxID=2643310 RepID=UPI0021DF7C94|nr:MULTISPECIES: glycosyl hydrolase 108 family protein [unclassified Xanthomonas]MDL5364561.1 glycosyl hydrolase 108 family protein [Xanthomonas sp. NCPPB 2654]UYC22834.1 N-acetylmuramidase [Xanthomonas sp. CFBP 8443]